MTRDNQGQSRHLSFTLNKMAATRFTPDAVSSRKRRSGRVGLSQHHKTDHHGTTTTEGTIENTEGSATNSWAVLARLVANYCHYTLFLYLCVCAHMHTKWLLDLFKSCWMTQVHCLEAAAAAVWRKNRVQTYSSRIENVMATIQL